MDHEIDKPMFRVYDLKKEAGHGLVSMYSKYKIYPNIDIEFLKERIDYYLIRTHRSCIDILVFKFFRENGGIKSVYILFSSATGTEFYSDSTCTHFYNIRSVLEHLVELSNMCEIHGS
jgi:hypothetical protein